jgi:hypothetical protein
MFQTPVIYHMNGALERSNVTDIGYYIRSILIVVFSSSSSSVTARFDSWSPEIKSRLKYAVFIKEEKEDYSRNLQQIDLIKT